MALYDLPDNTDVKVWPAAGLTLIGASLWTKDDVLATSRVTSQRLQTVNITATILATAFGMTGGDQTNLTFALRAFDGSDVFQNLAGNTTFLNRDVNRVLVNVGMIELLPVDWYFDLLVEQDGVAAGLTDVDITTALQFWTLDS